MHICLQAMRINAVIAAQKYPFLQVQTDTAKIFAKIDFLDIIRV